MGWDDDDDAGGLSVSPEAKRPGRSEGTRLPVFWAVLGVAGFGAVLFSAKLGLLPGSAPPRRVDKIGQVRAALDLAARNNLPMSYREIFPPYRGDPADNAALWLERLKPLAEAISAETKASLKNPGTSLNDAEVHRFNREAAPFLAGVGPAADCAVFRPVVRAGVQEEGWRSHARASEALLALTVRARGQAAKGDVEGTRRALEEAVKLSSLVRSSPQPLHPASRLTVGPGFDLMSQFAVCVSRLKGAKLTDALSRDRPDDPSVIIDGHLAKTAYKFSDEFLGFDRAATAPAYIASPDWLRALVELRLAVPPGSTDVQGALAKTRQRLAKWLGDKTVHSSGFERISASELVSDLTVAVDHQQRVALLRIADATLRAGSSPTARSDPMGSESTGYQVRAQAGGWVLTAPPQAGGRQTRLTYDGRALTFR